LQGGDGVRFSKPQSQGLLACWCPGRIFIWVLLSRGDELLAAVFRMAGRDRTRFAQAQKKIRATDRLAFSKRPHLGPGSAKKSARFLVTPKVMDYCLHENGLGIMQCTPLRNVNHLGNAAIADEEVSDRLLSRHRHHFLTQPGNYRRSVPRFSSIRSVLGEPMTDQSVRSQRGIQCADPFFTIGSISISCVRTFEWRSGSLSVFLKGVRISRQITRLSETTGK